ncbi:aminoglycoside phosphotransferase [Flavobacterium suaedae]|uniref:Aminoglycoside phosphotransferase n=1 Tax=Flavobacterium suaedae TaxID=1767027 RepID=A0ABQ1K5U7_9FLAO|nr:fructosamine kinase family protein [Flavobacterium suaedae]GGB86047.1 aminoglycoside phosphotransferase [Flavobacterium suaedae]
MQLVNILENDFDFKVNNLSTVHGGSINSAYLIDTTKGNYFLKVNDTHKYPQLFEKEANGLKTLQETSTFYIPKVIGYGNNEESQYLLLEWIEEGKPEKNTWQNFGEKLAFMHKQSEKSFGFAEDNYLGTYIQQNTLNKNWGEFYGLHRIMPMIKLIYQQGKIDTNTVKAAENFCKELNNIFPVEQPALLHGDLWSGNFIITKSGDAALIDPAIYYGHREMDIAMSKLFGGFSPEFYAAYNNTYVLEKGWEKRLPYAQLYPLLFHAWAFGGNYVTSCKQIVDQFVV